MEQKVVIDGYEFQNPEDAKIANEELAKVNRILYNLIVPAGTILLIPGKKEEK